MLTTKMQESCFLHGRMVPNEWHKQSAGRKDEISWTIILNASEKMVIKDELTI